MDRRRFLNLLPAAAFAGCALSPRPDGESAILPAQADRIPDVPFVVTEDRIVTAMLQLAEVKATDMVYDLGCGDGRIVIAAAKHYGARGVGMDLEPELIAIARGYADRARVADRTSFRVGDLFNTDLSPATVVTLYLSVDINKRLRPKLLRELKPGSRVVSNTFDMGGTWEPERTVEVNNTRIFLWRIPG
jgi:SAM-dependent methyltransferase